MTIDDLKETAALARLSFGEGELAAALPAFRQMLGYLAIMQAADEDAAAFPHGLNSSAPAAGSGFFRPDGESAAFDGEKLLDNAGEKDGRFLAVPNVL